MTQGDSSITIVGVGPGDPGARTIAVQHALDGAESIVLRTGIHPGIEDLVSDSRVVACDDLYASGESFDQVYQQIVDRVLGAAQHGPVVYVVPGSPMFGERTVQLLIERSRCLKTSIAIHPGVSALETIAVSLELDLASAQPQILDALDLSARVASEPFSGGMAAVDPTRPLIVAQVFDRHTASNVKHALARLYPDDHQTTVLVAAGTPNEKIEALTVSELDHRDHDHLTTVIVPPLPDLEATRSPATLFRIIAMLRAPDGCPWDRQQTHETLRDKIIEEAHEVAEAIVNDDPDALRDELGDLLLLVALCSQIAEESGTFTIEEVFEAVNAKLIRRHPHVFADVHAETPEEVLKTWTSVKQAEKASENGPGPALRYDQLPRSLSVLDRIRRSESVVLSGTTNDIDVVGQRLLTAVEEALALGVDPESALETAYRRKRLNDRQ